MNIYSLLYAFLFDQRKVATQAVKIIISLMAREFYLKFYIIRGHIKD